MLEMKKIYIYLLLQVLPLLAWSQSISQSTQWKWKRGAIVLQIPQRMEGQQTAIGLRTPKLEVVRVGFVGLGMRGIEAVRRFTFIPGTEIVALCDYEKGRAESCLTILDEACMPKADIYFGAEGYKALCGRNDIDLVYIATDWMHHFPVAECALQCNKHVAVEVPAAMNLEQCWSLIDLSEKKRRHCMILENCCYDWFELNTLNMVQHDVFGEIIRVQGAYIHNLEDVWSQYWKDGKDDLLGWRLKYNKENRGDIYPTHGLGPIAQVLNIHRGDRMKTLVAMDTKSVHGKKLVKQKTGKICNEFRNGDHTTTLIRTEKGKLIEIQHNVMTPQPYSRLYQLTGTKGLASKYPIEGYAIDAIQMRRAGVEPYSKNVNTHSYMSKENMNALTEHFSHPILQKYGRMAKEVGGHGGMDFVMDCRLIYCLQNGLPLDVYDLAEWCALAELGSISMDNGCAPVTFPDFTRGHWNEVERFQHAFALPEEELLAEMKAEIGTLMVKAKAMKGWLNDLNKQHRAVNRIDLEKWITQVVNQRQKVVEKYGSLLTTKEDIDLKSVDKLLKDAKDRIK